MRLVSAHPWHLVAGLVIWSVWFIVLYGGLSVACEFNPPPPASGVMNWLNLALLLLTLSTVAYLLLCTVLCWHRARHASKQTRFFLRTSGAVYLTSGLAALAIGLPVVVTAPCV